ncbi:MAG: flagellar assembly protein FliW [Vicinamibacterales bacterium]
MSAVPTTMLVETRFGAFQAAESDVVHIPGGVPGFEQCARYVLVGAPDIRPFTCLQGLDAPQPSFLVIDPRIVDPSYAAALSSADYRRLEASDRETLLWLAIVRVGPGDEATVNLRAPVIINPRRMIGIQALPHESAYRHDHPLRLETSRAGLHP